MAMKAKIGGRGAVADGGASLLPLGGAGAHVPPVARNTAGLSWSPGAPPPTVAGIEPTEKWRVPPVRAPSSGKIGTLDRF